MFSLKRLTTPLYPLGLLSLAICLVSLAASGCTKPRSDAQRKGAPTQEAAPTTEKTGEDLRAWLEGGTEVFRETFDGPAFSSDWQPPQGPWRIESGWAHVRGDKNRGLWWTGELPAKVRVEFDARSESPDGDLKFEIFATEPTHQGGYVCIFGGWKNRLHVIARLDEHGDDRKVRRGKKVVQSQTYRMAVVRVDQTLRWFIDGELFMSFNDAQPLAGKRFGLANWESPVFYDNVVITDLTGVVH